MSMCYLVLLCDVSLLDVSANLIQNATFEIQWQQLSLLRQRAGVAGLGMIEKYVINKVMKGCSGSVPRKGKLCM